MNKVVSQNRTSETFVRIPKLKQSKHCSVISKYMGTHKSTWRLCVCVIYLDIQHCLTLVQHNLNNDLYQTHIHYYYTLIHIPCRLGNTTTTYVDVSFMNFIDNDVRNSSQSTLQLPQQSSYKHTYTLYDYKHLQKSNAYMPQLQNISFSWVSNILLHSISSWTRNSAMAEGPRDSMSVEIL